MKRYFIAITVLMANVIVIPSFAQTDTSIAPVPTPMPPSAMAGLSPMPMPGMNGPLKANPRPIGYKTGFLGTMYITGVASGIGQWQTNPYPGDHVLRTDVSNGQIFIQKNDGVVQYFLQIGGYSLPDIGVAYVKSVDATKAYYGMFPQGFLKIAPSKNFSIQAGKLPTLIGAEYTFSFENMNTQRGLLWNQENAVNRGVQVNYTAGPVTLAASWNDGFYSETYSWAWLSAVYAINSSSSLIFTGGRNTKHTDIATSATPLYQNNQQIYGLTYLHTSGKWTIEPYLQYTHVPKIPDIDANQEASTSGAALYVNYSFKDNPDGSSINLPVRVEYINSTGSVDKGAPNLLYGPGSKAWSFTVTPTYQYKRFFARTEFSFVKANDFVSGSAFGPNGTSSTQTRVLLEAGVLF
jgi:hypothetical protein